MHSLKIFPVAKLQPDLWNLGFIASDHTEFPCQACMEEKEKSAGDFLTFPLECAVPCWNPLAGSLARSPSHPAEPL